MRQAINSVYIEGILNEVKVKYDSYKKDNK